MNVSEATSKSGLYQIDTAPAVKPRSKLLYVTNVSQNASHCQTAKHVESRAIFAEALKARVDQLGEDFSAPVKLEIKPEWDKAAITAQCPRAVATAYTFVKEVQSPTQDKVLLQKGISPADLNRFSSKREFDSSYDEFKTNYKDSLMIITMSEALKLLDGDIIKESLLSRDNNNVSCYETLNVQYAFLSKDGQCSEYPYGMYIVNMNDKNEKWILNFGGEIKKVEFSPNEEKTENKNETTVLRGSVGNVVKSYDRFSIRAGDLKNLVLKHYDYQIEGQRYSARGQTTFGNRNHALYHGLLDGARSTIIGRKTYLSYKNNDLPGIRENAAMNGAAIARAMPHALVATVVGVKTAGPAEGGMDGAISLLNSAGLSNAAELKKLFPVNK